MQQRPLHWSERAKMYPSTPGAGTGGAPQGGRPQPPKRPGKSQPPRKSQRPGSQAPRRPGSRKGLVIALTVLLLAAAAGALFYFWYLPTRSADAGDPEADARQLVLRAMNAINGSYAETNTFDPQTMTAEVLKTREPTINFYPVSSTSAATDPTALAQDQAVNYAGTQDSFAVGALSKSGTAYGVVVDKAADTVTYYLRGAPVDRWEQAAPTDSTTPDSQTPDTTQTSETISGPIALAKDIEAQTLLRNAMTVIESVHADVGTYSPAVMTAERLSQMEPSTTFVVRESDEAATAPQAFAGEKTIDFYGTADSFALGTTSESGSTFGLLVTVTPTGKTTTYFVNGTESDWTGAMTPVLGEGVSLPQ